MSGCNIYRIIQFKEALTSTQIIIYNDEGINSAHLYTYSWSTDGVCWTNWVNYDNYLRITEGLDSDFYLRIKIFGGLDKIIINDCIFTNYTISFDNSNIFLSNLCDSENLFQPYNGMECALQLQQQLTDSTICMLGIPIYYIKVTPNVETADYTFKEFTLHGVESIKQMKLIVPDGTMPSSNPRLTDFDFDWEIDWETELSKSHFSTAFGEGSFPKQRDLVYIPMMKRMWEVNSAYDEKNENLMWKSTTWKLALVKYNEKTNVDHGDFSNIIDNWVENTYDELFGKEEKNEQERLTATHQASTKFLPTNLYDIFMEDNIRKQYTKYDISILDKTYCHRSNVVARNIYKFKNDNACVTYQKNICGDCGTLSFMIETPGTLNGSLEKDILNFGEVEVRIEFNNPNFIIEFNGLKQEIDPFNTYMVISRWNRSNFTSELNIYKLSHRGDIPVYRLKPEMYYFDFENPICELTGNYNNDYIMSEPQLCQIHPYPVQMTNIKFYDRYLNKEDALKECIKYTTTHESCIINDLARPVTSGQGYSVR